MVAIAWAVAGISWGKATIIVAMTPTRPMMASGERFLGAMGISIFWV